jgi:hypothetical protein
MAVFMPDFSPIDVAVKLDSNGRPIAVFDGSATAIVDLQTVTIPLANERSTVLNQSVQNEFRIVQASNDRINELNNAMQELQRISPTGVNDNKQANVDVPTFVFSPTVALSQQTIDTLRGLKDASGTPISDLFAFGDGNNAPTNHVVSMNSGKTFSQVTTIMKSAVDQASQNNQLEMTTLQGLTNKFNQSIETMSDLVSKFTDLNGKLAGNFRPLR